MEKLTVLPVVKAYPEPSKKYGTTVCVAAVTIPEGRWVRLYPVRFPHLALHKRFKKYQIFEADAAKAERDTRPESYRIDEDSIRIVGEPIGTAHGWSERKRLLAAAPVSSLCELQRLRKVSGKSLGMIRVREVTGFDVVEADDEKHQAADWTAEHDAASLELFNDNKQKVEALPFKFRYHFRCLDPSCRGHKCSIIDWEAYELHRKMVVVHGEQTAVEKVRQKYVDDLCGADKETYFFMGNMARHPDSFLVLGVFYPNLGASPTLFEFAEMDPAARTKVPAKPEAPSPEESLF